MKHLLILALLSVALAQKINTDSVPMDITPVYVTSAAEVAQLKADWKLHELCMAKKDSVARNACFHPTHHKFFVDCQQQIKNYKLPTTAVCDEATGYIRGKDYK